MFNYRTNKILLLIARVLWIMAATNIKAGSKLESRLREIGAEIALLQKEMK